jgi:hypothetical protein
MHSLATLRRRAWQALRAKIDEQIVDAAIISKLRAHFEKRFRTTRPVFHGFGDRTMISTARSRSRKIT